MRVVFLEDVHGVAFGGDIKDVKNGFARNYLIPKSLAVPVTHNTLQQIKRLKKESDTARLKTLSDMRALAEEIDGTELGLEMRAGANGRLYGSVTNTILADELSRVTDREIDRRTITIAEPIREIGTYDVSVQLHPEISAQIKVKVYPTGTDPLVEEETKKEDSAGNEESVLATLETSPAEMDETVPEPADSTELAQDEKS